MRTTVDLHPRVLATAKARVAAGRGLLRLAMNPKVMGVVIEASSALESLQSLRSDPRAEFLADASSLAEARIDIVGLAGFRQVTEFHLVNLAATHGGRLVTVDTRIQGGLVPTDRGLVCRLV